MYLVLSNDDFRRKSFCKNSSRLLINSLRMLLSSEHSHKTCSSLPAWLPRPLLHKICQRRSLYRRALFSDSPSDWQLYRSTRNSILNELCLAKSNSIPYLNLLTPSGPMFALFVKASALFPNFLPQTPLLPPTLTKQIS